MTLNYNLTGAARKAFARVIGEILNQPVVYMGTPSFAFNIGGYIVDRNGALSCDENAGTSQLPRLAAMLEERGYAPETAPETPDFRDLRLTEREELGLRERHDHWGEDGMRADEAPERDDNALVLELPREQFSDGALDNLKKIVESKAAIFKKVFGADDLPIEDVGDKLRFPWFTLTGENEAAVVFEFDAYSRFIFAIGEMAKRQKRVTAKPRDFVNEKFAMRVFLLRLGFIGPAYIMARRILLRNLTGNGSWKYGRRQRRFTCLNCGHSFSDGTVASDELGAYTNCPECGGSFDVEAPAQASDAQEMEGEQNEKR